MALEPQRVPRAIAAWSLASVVIGTLVLEAAISVLQPPTRLALARGGALCGLMLAAHVGLRRRETALGQTASNSTAAIRPLDRASLLLLGLFVLPLVADASAAWWKGSRWMPETAALAALRNLGLGLGALAGRPAFNRLAMIVALFSTLIGSSLVEEVWINGLVGALALTGTFWLLFGDWLRLPGRRIRSNRRPWIGWLATASALGLAGVVLAVGPRTAMVTLASLAPTSGGAAWSDPEARLGVGDGPNEVEALDDADSVGFTQSEVYLETDRPSLYDAFNDTFGEPFKKSTTDRAIALQSQQIEERRERPSEDQRAGREFSIRRKPPPRTRPPDERADALLYVQGPAPAHLRLVAFDTFDGQAWREGPTAQPGSATARIQAEGPESAWLVIDGFEPSYLAGPVRHRLKLGLLETSVLPTPSLLTRFRVGGVNRSDFFEWSQPRLPRMADRTIPGGTIIETEARTVDPEALRSLALPTRQRYAPRRYRETPDSSTLRQRARQWIAGRPRGWSQVEAVIQGLQHDCEYDAQAAPPLDCPDPIDHFLNESRRGPAYLFATTAALALRSIGYPTRLVGGYYADPRRRDLLTRHIPIGESDAHLWVEVQLPGGVWIPVEPTPGFELLKPRRDWLRLLSDALTGTSRWIAAHLGTLTVTTILSLGFIFRRRWIHERGETFRWWIMRPFAKPERLVLGTLKLLERRAATTGWNRPASATPRRWYAPAALRAEARAGRALVGLLQTAESLTYGPSGRPLPCDNTDRLCCRVVRLWTASTFRKLGHPATPNQEPTG